MTIRKLLIAIYLVLVAVAARAERWVPKDSTDKSIRVILTSSATGAPATGLTVTDIDVYVWREGAAVTAKFDCTDLGSENAAHSDTGAYEGGALGIYRIDLPDTAWATGADYVDIAVVHADCITAFVHVALTGVNPNDSTPAVDVTEVSGDATAANNLEAILDGTGVASDVDITMRSLTITHDAGTAVDIAGQIGMHVEGTGDPWGWAVYLEGGNMGNGLYVLGGDEASAVKFSASNATGYHGLELYGMGSGSGLYAWTSIMGDQGYGIRATSFKGGLQGNITGNLSGSVGSVTGHTPQTGDSFARLGAPAGASVSADIAAVKADTAIESIMLLSTTIATVNSQTSLVLTAGADVADAYDNCTIVIYDASNNSYPTIRRVKDYAADKIVTLNAAGAFTVAIGDTVKIFAFREGSMGGP